MALQSGDSNASLLTTDASCAELGGTDEDSNVRRAFIGTNAYGPVRRGPKRRRCSPPPKAGFMAATLLALFAVCNLTGTSVPSVFKKLRPLREYVQPFMEAKTNNQVMFYEGLIMWASREQLCLDVFDGNITNGTFLQVWTCWGLNPNQQFIMPMEKGMIRWALHPDRCIDVVKDKNTSGLAVEMWECNDNRTSMQFRMPRDGQGPIRWDKDPKQCLTLDQNRILHLDFKHRNPLDGAMVVMGECPRENNAKVGYDGPLVNSSSLWLIPAANPTYKIGDTPQRLNGQYGYLSEFWIGAPEQMIRIDQMHNSFSITEFQFYLAFAGFSHPPEDKQESWTCSVEKRQVKKDSVADAVNHIRSFGGRAWLYLHAQAVDVGDRNMMHGFHQIPQELVDDKVSRRFFEAFGGARQKASAKSMKYADICGCQMASTMLTLGDKNSPSLMSMVHLNAAWAVRIVPQWAMWAARMNFSGIHWDTEGQLGVPMDNKTGDPRGDNDIPAFLRAALPYLQEHSLVQTLNFMDGYGWDPSLLQGQQAIAFPYWELWNLPGKEYWFYLQIQEFAASTGFVSACYPGWTKYHCCLHDERQNAGEYGTWPLDLAIARWQKAHRHGGSYLLIGDGLRHLQGPYLPDAVHLAWVDVVKVQSMVSVRPPWV